MTVLRNVSVSVSLFHHTQFLQENNPCSNKMVKLALSVICVLAVVATACAGVVGHGHDNGDYYAHPRYQYSYGVNDHYTGDVKQASEVRDGDAVKGEYSLVEPDGHLRTVTYVADHHGFRANVHRSPAHHGR